MCSHGQPLVSWSKEQTSWLRWSLATRFVGCLLDECRHRFMLCRAAHPHHGCPVCVWQKWLLMFCTWSCVHGRQCDLLMLQMNSVECINVIVAKQDGIYLIDAHSNARFLSPVLALAARVMSRWCSKEHVTIVLLNTPVHCVGSADMLIDKPRKSLRYDVMNWWLWWYHHHNNLFDVEMQLSVRIHIFEVYVFMTVLIAMMLMQERDGLSPLWEGLGEGRA